MGLRKKLDIRIIKQAIRDRGKGLRATYLQGTVKGGRIGKEHEKITNQYRGDHVQEWQRQQERDVSIDVPKIS